MTCDASGYAALDSGVALFDLSDRGKVKVAGEDRVRFLQGQLTCDVAKLAPCTGSRAAVLDRTSKVLADLNLLATKEAFYADLEPGLEGPFLERLRRYVVAARVVLEDATASLGLLSLQGAQLPLFAREVLGVDWEGFDEYASVEARVGEALLWPTRLNRTGRPGLDLWCRAADAPALSAALAAAGAVQAGPEVLEVARVEGGFPRYGADITANHLLQEVDLPGALSLTKGCYVGQEVVARVHARGHLNRLRAGIAVEGAAAAGDPVLLEGREHPLTSAAFSPRLCATVGFAYLRPGPAREYGLACTVRTAAGELPARVEKYPFI